MTTDPSTLRPACYSSSLKYVFIHIPKCAGTSIHRALRTLHETRSLSVDERKYHKHTKARDVHRLLGPLWEQSFKFTFVRNPWDLMVSCYHWWLLQAGQYSSLAVQASEVKAMNTFANFMRSPFGLEMINEQPGKDLLDWITADGKIVVDFVGRFETLTKDWEQICQNLGVEPVKLTWENASGRGNYRPFYDAVSKRAVAERFRKTIELFGYEF